MNSKHKGNLGVASAITYFLSIGCRVSLPFGDDSRYDLIVDDGNILQRIQVKTTKSLNKRGRYQVELRTKGGNKTGTGRTSYISESECDSVFIHVVAGPNYLIPSRLLANKGSLVLSKDKDMFLV